MISFLFWLFLCGRGKRLERMAALNNFMGSKAMRAVMIRLTRAVLLFIGVSFYAQAVLA